MTRAELIARLRACAANGDTEVAHGDADDALIEYINDPDVKDAYDAVSRWHA